jgi:steroid delta-isomerase-like uncharacterized protein
MAIPKQSGPGGKPGTHRTGPRKESVKSQGEPHSLGSKSSEQRFAADKDTSMKAHTGSSNTETARLFFDAYNQHDVERMLRLCASDAQIDYVPMGEQGRGSVNAVGKQIWTGLLDAFPNLHVRPQSVFGDEHNAAAEVIIGGTQRKDFLDIPNQGRHYELPHAFLLRLNEKQLITRIAAYWDNVSFYSQLGQEPMPKAA